MYIFTHKVNGVNASTSKNDKSASFNPDAPSDLPELPFQGGILQNSKIKLQLRGEDK